MSVKGSQGRGGKEKEREKMGRKKKKKRKEARLFFPEWVTHKLK